MTTAAAAATITTVHTIQAFAKGYLDYQDGHFICNKSIGYLCQYTFMVKIHWFLGYY